MELRAQRCASAAQQGEFGGSGQPLNAFCSGDRQDVVTLSLAVTMILRLGLECRLLHRINGSGNEGIPKTSQVLLARVIGM
jgi:hypothetical protein